VCSAESWFAVQIDRLGDKVEDEQLAADAAALLAMIGHFADRTARPLGHFGRPRAEHSALDQILAEGDRLRDLVTKGTR
jgi:hypothetical protein